MPRRSFFIVSSQFFFDRQPLAKSIYRRS